jgi:uncharacterized protein DUF4214
MQKIAIVFSLLILLATAALAQSPPTLRIVTEDPTLPSELFYGNVKVKPLRLRPGTNVPITIDDSDFFVQEHYIDFLSRFPEQGGFQAWLDVLNSCNNDASCLYGPNGKRILVSQSFFGSQEFNLKGGYVFRFYRASFGQTFAQLPKYVDMVAGMRSVTGATADEVNQKRTAFATNWVLRGDFLTAYPRSLTPTQFVDNISATAGITLSNRSQIISDLTTAGNSDAGRAVAMRAIADSQEEQNKEFNPSFVYMQYIGYLRRDPEEGGFTSWLNYLTSHPGDFNTMVWGFVDSAEYRNRF